MTKAVNTLPAAGDMWVMEGPAITALVLFLGAGVLTAACAEPGAMKAPVEVGSMGGAGGARVGANGRDGGTSSTEGTDGTAGASAPDASADGGGSVAPHPPGGPIKLTGSWPNLQGPNGNYSSDLSDVALLDDLTHARLVWESEEKAISTARGERTLDYSNAKLPPGGPTSPIVHDGRIYLSYYVPSGDVWDVTLEQMLGTKFRKPFFLIDADEIVLAIDAATGKTVWKKVFTGKGLHNPSLKRGGWGATPTAFDGRVFAAGTTGRLYALDAKTGAVLWEKDVGPMHTSLEAMKATALANRRLPDAPDMLQSLTYAQGVLIVPDFRGGLRGHDPATGALLWEAANVTGNQTTPSRWRSGGREYLLVGNPAGELRLIDPKSGKALWTVPGLAPFRASVIATETHAFVLRALSKERSQYVAYRITPQEAKEAWRLPDRYLEANEGDHSGTHTVVAQGGLVYFLPDGMPQDGLVVARETTGEVVAERIPSAASDMPFIWEDRVVIDRDAHHGASRGGPTYVPYAMGASGLSLLGRPWQPRHLPGTGYEVPLVHPYVSGFMFIRTDGGTVVAYDLRKWPRSFRPPPAPFANLPPPAGVEALPRIETGERFNWAMQPSWWAATGQIILPDYREDRLWVVDAATGRGDVFREEVLNPNFTTIDPKGNLVFPGGKGLTVLTPDGKAEVWADLDGEDGIFRSDGNFYLSTGFELVRLDPTKQRTSFDKTVGIRGLLLSPDGRTLYASHADSGRIWKFPLAADGTPGPGAVHLDLKAQGIKPVGLCHDTAGNFFLPGGTTLYVVNPQGMVVGKYWAGGYGTMGCTFGDADLRTLYVATRSGLYKRRMEAPGYAQ